MIKCAIRHPSLKKLDSINGNLLTSRMDFAISNKLQYEVRNICRICLQKVTQPTDLKPEINTKELLNKIFLCFQINITLDKYLVFCKTCIEELNIAYKFRQKCIDNMFHNFYQSIIVSEEDFNSEKVKINEMNDSNQDEGLKDNVHKDNLNSLDVDIKKLNKDIGNKIFSSTYSNKMLKDKFLLNSHQNSLHKNRKKRGKVTGVGPNRCYYCTECSYSTPHSQTLVNHMRRHNGDRPYLCHCGKNFTQSSSLSAHLKTHSDITYFTCSTCGKQFKHAYSLKKHLNVHKLGQFSCDICGKQLKSRQSLQDHMCRHYNIRNYNCEDCGDTFITCSELLNHKKKHIGVNKVECHVCGYKTHHKRNLIIHLKRHAGDKPFKCNSCIASFYTSGDLQRHTRVHTRDKPFPCPTCKQKFAHSTSLNKHMLTAHGIEYKWADIKSKESRQEIKPLESC